jgi:pimeloyl-ACP methyl ester carboxylesterase
MSETWSHHEGIVNGVKLHWVEQGDGPLVLLLHGFPEFWYSWRHQIPALARAGFRAVAPDMRGYHLSEKPKGVGAYRMEKLTADVVALAGSLGEKQAHVVGHDWGGYVAWHLPNTHPGFVRSLSILNAPHPAAYRRALRTRDQRRRSRYVFLFQIPWLPERKMRAKNFALLEKMMRRDTVTPGAFSGEDIRRYKDALSEPGALTAAINYYRAMFRRPPPRKWSDERITVPTLVLWGTRDRYLAPFLADGLGEWITDLRVERLEASHWVQNDVPGRVNELLAGFLRSHP